VLERQSHWEHVYSLKPRFGGANVAIEYKKTRLAVGVRDMKTTGNAFYLPEVKVDGG
jgi:hypothetical protein